MIKPATVTEYLVWVGGTEIGQYPRADMAQEVYEDWRKEGYDDVVIQEIEVDNETPEEVNEWLRQGGW